MKNKFELSFETCDAEVGCKVMDWLNDNRVEYTARLKDTDRSFVFDILATRLNVNKVSRFITEEVNYD